MEAAFNEKNYYLSKIAYLITTVFHIEEIAEVKFYNQVNLSITLFTFTYLSLGIQPH